MRYPITVQFPDRTKRRRTAGKLADCMRLLLAEECSCVTLRDAATDIDGDIWNVDLTLYPEAVENRPVEISFWRDAPGPIGPLDEPWEIDNEGDVMWPHANDGDCTAFATEIVERLGLTL